MKRRSPKDLSTGNPACSGRVPSVSLPHLLNLSRYSPGFAVPAGIIHNFPLLEVGRLTLPLENKCSRRLRLLRHLLSFRKQSPRKTPRLPIGARFEKPTGRQTRRLRMPQVIRPAAGEGHCPSPERIGVLRSRVSGKLSL